MKCKNIKDKNIKDKNIKDKNYTGKENTPLGLGYSAMGEKVDKRMAGRDGNMYIVKKYKNGKRWTKVISSSRKRSPRMYDEKEYEYRENIILIPTESAIIDDREVSVGTTNPLNGTFYMYFYQYIDRICGINLTVLVEMLPDGRMQWVFKCENKDICDYSNDRCQESLRILKYFKKTYQNSKDWLLHNVYSGLVLFYTKKGVINHGYTYFSTNRREDEKMLDQFDKQGRELISNKLVFDGLDDIDL